LKKVLIRREEIAMPFRDASIRKFLPIAGVLLAFEAGWVVLVLYVFPWLAHS
jgi:hypothetical protein